VRIVRACALIAALSAAAPTAACSLSCAPPVRRVRVILIGDSTLAHATGYGDALMRFPELAGRLERRAGTRLDRPAGCRP